MAPRSLPTATMVALSTAWTDPGQPILKALLDVETVAPLVKKLKVVARDLVAFVPVAGTSPLATLQADAANTDVLHDRSLRGVHLILTGLAELAADGAESEGWIALRDTLFEDGLAGVKASYVDESGAAKAAAIRFNSAAAKQLDAVKLAPKRTLGDGMRRYLAAGKKLGELESDRAQLEAEPTGKGPAYKARMRWVGIANAMTQALALEDEIAPVLQKGVLDRLRAEEAKTEHVGRVPDEAAAPEVPKDAPK